MSDDTSRDVRSIAPVLYGAHFGFSEAPFSITPDPRYLYRSEHHREALAHLLYSVEEEGGFVQLTGEVGTGKTTMCRCFLESLPPHVDVALILNPRLTGLELVATVCDELGVSYPAGATSVKVLIDALSRHLLDAHARGRRTVLILDEAQELGVEALEEVRLLTNLETTRTKLLQIVLVGQPELTRLLERPKLRPLAQRVTARYHLGSLSADETRAYIRHRLVVAGGSEGTFSTGAIRCVHRLAGGVPRLVNIICDRALLGAYTEGRLEVTSATALRAAAEVFGSWPGLRRSRALRRSAAVAAVGATLAVALVLLAPGRVSQLTAPGGRVESGATDPSRGAPVGVAALGPGPPGSRGAETTADAVPESSTRLADVLRDLSAGDDERSAFASLLARWRLDRGDADGALPCERVRRQGLECVSRVGTWRKLRHFDVPAIMLLVTPTGARHYAVLAALGTDHATLQLGGRPFTFRLREIDPFWEGPFTLLWKPPAVRKLPITPGSRGSDVEWLRRRLADIDGRQGETGPRDLYDGELGARVISFQRSRGLFPDGIVGMETVSQLRAAVREPGIPWLPESAP